jgi:sec-independent protein translocase protein TatA
MAELLVVLAIFVLLFGAKRLPALADGMGKAIRNFKKGLNSADEDVTPPPKQVTEASSAAEIGSPAGEPQSAKRADGT